GRAPGLSPEPRDALLGVADAVDRLAHALDQAPLEALGEFDAADRERHRDPQPRQAPLALHERARLLLELHEVLAVGQVLRVRVVGLADQLQRPLDLGLELLLGALLLVEDPRVAHADLAGPEPFA